MQAGKRHGRAQFKKKKKKTKISAVSKHKRRKEVQNCPSLKATPVKINENMALLCL